MNVLSATEWHQETLNGNNFMLYTFTKIKKPKQKNEQINPDASSRNEPIPQLLFTVEVS